MYQGDDYDAAGAAIGVMYERHRLPRKEEMSEGDILIGLASDGCHSNGFSLIRRIIARENLSYTDPAPWDKSTSIGVNLLTPTRLYVRPLLPIIEKELILGLSHITGGGLSENIPRMLPKSLAAEVDVGTWQLPPVFKWLKQAGNVTSVEMGRTFNTGVGMVAVVRKENAQQVISELEVSGEKVYTIGRLIPRVTEKEGCVLKNLEFWD